MNRTSIMRTIEILTVFSAVFVAASQPAQAYLDPGSGSYAMQVAIAGIFGFLFSAKMFWARIKESLFASPRRAANETTSAGKND
ncbi:MAG: hypothetical protein V4671_32655 [Armatimonadota bacterium]